MGQSKLSAKFIKAVIGGAILAGMAQAAYATGNDTPAQDAAAKTLYRAERDRIYTQLHSVKSAGLVGEDADLCAAGTIAHYSLALKADKQNNPKVDMDREIANYLFAQSLAAMMSCNNDPRAPVPDVVTGKPIFAPN